MRRRGESIVERLAIRRIIGGMGSMTIRFELIANSIDLRIPRLAFFLNRLGWEL